MALLSRTPRPTARTSRAPGDPLAEQVAAAAARADVAEVERLLAEAGTDWDRRDRCVAVAVEQPEQEWPLRWAADRPDSATACTVAAAASCGRAWLARGHGRGHELSAREVDGWFAHLERAEELLARAVRLDDADPTPWAYALLTARGLQLAASERVSRWEQLRRRDPLHRHGHRQALRGATPQWSGSAQDVLDLVEAATQAAPPGAGVHALWPEAHVELWRWHGMQDPPDPEGEARYWDDEAVRAQVAVAWDRWSAAPALQPAWVVDDANLFAFALSATGDRERAQAAFDRTGGVLTEDPWSYRSEAPHKAFAAARAAAGG